MIEVAIETVIDQVNNTLFQAQWITLGIVLVQYWPFVSFFKTD
jgi:hypothetical protein